MGCQNTCGGGFLYIEIFLATLYIIQCLLAFDEHVHIIICIVFLHIVMIDIFVQTASRVK